MTLRPKYFPDVGSSMNLELARGASTGLREAVVLQEMRHKVSYDWDLLVDCFFLSPNPILEYYTGRFLLLDVEESRRSS